MHEDIGKEEITELFSQYDFIIKDIDIIEEENLANVYIVVGDTDLYRIVAIDNVIKKIKEMEGELINEGMIEYIMFGDLYQGIWRILIYFKKEE